MNKYVVAEKFLNMVKANDQYIEQVPFDLREVIIDNQYSSNQANLIHQLLGLLLSETELDDLLYFAYEFNPKIVLDERVEFTDLISYWKHLDAGK